ncbi:MAG TPA: tRNA (5-methylaminomethyl-2-thiouridine)(34)-methyltransferase MnmD [Flavisolibacter sp.]|nr:tRNA (5-methylaminomethyl-2-thiouridine)(34)-methyltransferase MnmD [Flavisolibacter sp.]
MEKEIIITRDGSNSIAVPKLNVTYHSIHGAIQESKHVFIEAGLNHVLNNVTNQPLCIFEMGFGTGLNALLTALEAEKYQRKIFYTAVEAFPLSIEEVKGLNYSELLEHKDWFQQIHESDWQEDVRITPHLTLRKERVDLINYSSHQRFNLIYYDAFAPSVQPELWTKEIFEKLFLMLQHGGVLVTYCSKGDVRRAMIAAGFDVEKLTGAPGKREMLRATRPTQGSN